MDNEVKEILCITQEECAEVSQIVSKIFRFGWESTHPTSKVSNKERLEEEIGDLLAMVDIMVEKCLLSDSNLNTAKYLKREKLKNWSSITNL